MSDLAAPSAFHDHPKMSQASPAPEQDLPVDADLHVDAIIVGAGFAGLYMLHRLRQAGRTARVYEAGSDVGGTWYWNRYPGARCDAESLAYSYSFSPELEKEWSWTERYATQPEILRYAQHVADRFDLKSDIRFERRVESAHFDEANNIWSVSTDRNDSARAPVLIMATGCLSVPIVPEIAGLDSFEGRRLQASAWPHEPVDFAGQRVGVIGTGSSAIQAIPEIAKQASHVTVFQRTPNFSVPAHNQDLDPEFEQGFKKNYPEHRRFHRLGLASGFGDLDVEPKEFVPATESALDPDDKAWEAICEDHWQVGGAIFLRAAADVLTSEEANARLAAFVHGKIRDIVEDPETAEALCPTTYPIGTKRICVDTDYYATFNRDNVRLVDLTQSPIERVEASGVTVGSRSGGSSDGDGGRSDGSTNDDAHEKIELDTLVLATGFDAMTGALDRIDFRGRNGQSLSSAWHDGPSTYLGLMVSGFPNLFTITGPGSPSVLSNMLVSIEQHVDLIMDCLDEMTTRGAATVEPDEEAQAGWVAHVNEVANATLMPKAGSWYMGANVPGKPRVFMPYGAGVGIYREICEGVKKEGWRGFSFAKP
ncbi:MAG: flavin-containing monooxygenase [Myxococcota bacterium]